MVHIETDFDDRLLVIRDAHRAQFMKALRNYPKDLNRANDEAEVVQRTAGFIGRLAAEWQSAGKSSDSAASDARDYAYDLLFEYFDSGERVVSLGFEAAERFWLRRTRDGIVRPISNDDALGESKHTDLDLPTQTRQPVTSTVPSTIAVESKGDLKADTPMTNRERIDAYKREVIEDTGKRITDTDLAKAANPRWNERTPITRFKSGKRILSDGVRKRIEDMLRDKPHLSKPQQKPAKPAKPAILSP